MSTILKCLPVALSVFVAIGAWAAEQVRTLDLREIAPVVVSVSGKQVMLVITGQPPHILTFTNAAPSQLSSGNKPTSKLVRVTYGRDLVGFARVLRTDPQGAVRKASLIFETEEQAAAAGKALRPGSAKPSPLPKDKEKK
jgi:hypothetical protein